MCGIAGFVGAGGLDVLQAMSDALVHRGPDGAGRHVDADDGVHFAHRRLAIIDIGGGEQPMWNEDGQVGIIFNGEIYNHVELRAELVACGHTFRSHHSDTEVLVHGYEQWGEQLPERLNGMFAFAIHDRRRRQVFLARDRFGKKPLYYSRASGLPLAFASELTALLKHPGVERSIDPMALRKYFAYGFIPAPNSLYRGVSKLPGGHWMRLDIPSGQLERRRYWQFSIQVADRLPPDPEAEWGEQLRALLSQAVKRRMVSDVPLGVFLSGGIDSSAVLAFATQHLAGVRAKTYSIGFDEPSFDESIYAQQVAERFGSEHHTERLNLDKAATLVPHVLDRLDEPMGDSSILPTYLLSRFARTGVTVALGGDGGDELFAGYDPFKALATAEWYGRVVPRWAHRGLRRLADMLPVSSANMSFDFKVKRTLRGLSYPQAAWNPAWLGSLEPADLGELFNEPVHAEEVFAEAMEAWNSSTADNVVDKTLEFYSRFYLQDAILTKVDRASMMVSLEVRAPFLDNDVVNLARTIPHRYKYRNGTTKYLLKKALEPVLPHEIIYRKKKGFGVPLTRWLKGMQEPAVSLRDPRPDADWVHQRFEEHRAGTMDHRLFLWNWMVLQSHLQSAAG